MNRFPTLLAAVALAPLGFAQASASTGAARPITVTVAGRSVTFTSGSPMTMQGQLLVPFRAILEGMGAQVTYDPATRRIIASRAGREVTLAAGSNAATVDGRRITMSLPATARAGTTYIPLRFVAESLGAKTMYDAATRAVTIEPPAAEPSPGSGAPSGASDAQNLASENGASNDSTNGMDRNAPANGSTIAPPPSSDANASDEAANMAGNGTANDAANSSGTTIANVAENAGLNTVPGDVSSASAVTNPDARPTATESGTSWMTYLPWIVLAVVALFAGAWLLARPRAGKVIASDGDKTA